MDPFVCGSSLLTVMASLPSTTVSTISGLVDRARRILGVDLLDDLLDAILRRDRFVVDELHFGRAAQRQPFGQQVADEPAGALEGFLRLLALGGVADDRPVDARQRQIAGHLGAGDGDQAHARIADLGR